MNKNNNNNNDNTFTKFQIKCTTPFITYLLLSIFILNIFIIIYIMFKYNAYDYTNIIGIIFYSIIIGITYKLKCAPLTSLLFHPPIFIVTFSYIILISIHGLTNLYFISQTDESHYLYTLFIRYLKKLPIDSNNITTAFDDFTENSQTSNDVATIFDSVSSASDINNQLNNITTQIDIENSTLNQSDLPAISPSSPDLNTVDLSSILSNSSSKIDQIKESKTETTAIPNIATLGLPMSKTDSNTFDLSAILNKESKNNKDSIIESKTNTLGLPMSKTDSNTFDLSAILNKESKNNKVDITSLEF